MRFRTLALSVWTRIFILVLSFGLSLTSAIAAGPTAPSNLRGSVVTSTSFNIIWDDNSTDETMFSMIYSANGGSQHAPDLFASAGTGTRSTGFDVAGLGWNNATIQIRATNASGSTYSNTVNLTFNVSYNPPSSPLLKAQTDGSFLVMWTDNASNEAGYSIEYATASGGPYSVMGYTAANYTGMYTGSLAPATTYYFRVRAFQGTPENQTNYTAYSSVVSGTTPATLLAPTGLSVTATNETSLNFSLTDNTALNTGYQVEYGPTGSGQFSNFGEVGDYTAFSASDMADPGTAYDFRIRAFYDNGSGSRVYSAYSNTGSVTTPFYAPSGLAATATGESSVNLTWTDNSSAEHGYAVYYKVHTDGSYTRYLYTAANATSQSLTGLSPGTSYDFQVAAAYQSTAVIESARSNTLTVSTKDSFTSRTYQPITHNQPFTYQAVVSAGSTRSSWNITGLPSGISFNNSTGVVSGTPTVTGVFACPMTATFANGWTTNTTLTLRIIRAPGAPIAATSISTQTIGSGGNTSVALADKFSDPDAESAVRLVTNLGTMDFILYNSATPETVANFLSYVNNANSSGNYNGAVFHRSISNFVVQGGGFKVQSPPNNFTKIATTASPVNEPGISSLRGTVAMAKLGSDPNSATDEFFVNLADNSANLDNQNGGFTVFARVAGNGMAVADSIAALPTVSSSVQNPFYIDGSPYTVDSYGLPAFADWPLTESSASMDNSMAVTISSAAPVAVLSYSVTGNTNPAVVGADISGTNLQINGLAGGQSNVTVTATDLDGNTTSQSFTVNVNQAPAFTSSPPPSPAVKNVAYSFTCTASGFPVPSFAVTAGSLPTGLNLESNGVITGTPTATGTFTGTITASSSAGSATQNFSITVNQTPAFTSSTPAGTALVGSVYSFTCTASGVPSPTFSVTAGTLPTGINLASTGVISGTPTVGGTFTGIITASNSAGTTTQNFSITVNVAADGWAASYELTGTDALVDADPDHDGRTNLMEFAFMTDPTSSGSGNGPECGMGSSADSKYGEITFPVRSFAPTLIYTVEVSDSLTSGSWSTLWSSADGFAAAVVTNQSVDPVLGCNWITVRDTVPSPPAIQRFFRVTVSQP